MDSDKDNRGREKWTPERIKEMLKWEKENGADHRQGAEHFGISYKTYTSAIGRYRFAGLIPAGDRRHTKRGPYKRKPGHPAKALVRTAKSLVENPFSKGMRVVKRGASEANYIDIPHVGGQATEQSIPIVMCPLSKLKQVLGELQ